MRLTRTEGWAPHWLPRAPRLLDACECTLRLCVKGSVRQLTPKMVDVYLDNRQRHVVPRKLSTGKWHFLSTVSPSESYIPRSVTVRR
eukprot:scaffold15804_cov60-Phaeocystis_antarctica.AAC.3